MRAGLSSKSSEVQTPARAVIWIEISVPCKLLHCLWDHKSMDSRASPEPGIHPGAATLVVKKKHDLKSNDTGTENKTGEHHNITWKKAKK